MLAATFRFEVKGMLFNYLDVIHWNEFDTIHIWYNSTACYFKNEFNREDGFAITFHMLLRPRSNAEFNRFHAIWERERGCFNIVAANKQKSICIISYNSVMPSRVAMPQKMQICSNYMLCISSTKPMSSRDLEKKQKPHLPLTQTN